MNITPQAYQLLRRENQSLKETINQLKEELKSQGESYRNIAAIALSKELEHKKVLIKLSKMKLFIDKARDFLQDSNEISKI